MECVHTNTQETYYYINEAATYISVRHINTLHQEDLTNYERVYITDLCPSKSLLEKMAFIDAKLFQVYDHHVTSLKEKEIIFFVYIGDDEKDCAMSIFYQELLKDFPTLKENKTLEELVNLR